MLSMPFYETVSKVEREQEEVLSATDVDDSLMGEDKRWRQYNKLSRREKISDFFLSYRWILNTGLLFIIVGLLLLLLRQETHHQFRCPTTGQVGGDFNGAGPIFDIKVVKFEEDMRFTPLNSSEMFTPANLALWNTMMPINAGSEAITNGQTFFTTTMTHQLHCLYMMGRIFSGMVLNTTQSLPENSIPKDWHRHFLHCVDYMRQSVMCAADMATEAHESDEPDEIGPLDAGWRGYHVCKDYSQVRAYIEGQISDGIRVTLALDD